MSLQKEFEKEIQNKIDKLNGVKKELDYLPKDLPDACEAIVTISGRFRIGMPLDPPLNKQVRRRFTNAGYEVSDFKLDDWGFMKNAGATLKIDDQTIYFDLACFDYKEGSTCKIHKIGEIKESKPVYEVRCE